MMSDAAGMAPRVLLLAATLLASACLHRDAIVKHLRRGLATPAIGILPPTSWAFAPDVFAFSYDPARARTLLDAAGYFDADGDGPAPRMRLSLKVSNVEFNRGFFQNPRVDRLLDAATVATDDGARRRLYGEVQSIAAADAPYISLWHKTTVAVAQRTPADLRLLHAADFTFLKDVSRTPPDGRAAP